MGYLFEAHPLVVEHLVPALLGLYSDIEYTERCGARAAAAAAAARGLRWRRPWRPSAPRAQPSHPAHAPTPRPRRPPPPQRGAVLHQVQHAPVPGGHPRARVAPAAAPGRLEGAARARAPRPAPPAPAPVLRATRPRAHANPTRPATRDTPPPPPPAPAPPPPALCARGRRLAVPALHQHAHRRRDVPAGREPQVHQGAPRCPWGGGAEQRGRGAGSSARELRVGAGGCVRGISCASAQAPGQPTRPCAVEPRDRAADGRRGRVGRAGAARAAGEAARAGGQRLAPAQPARAQPGAHQDAGLHERGPRREAPPCAPPCVLCERAPPNAPSALSASPPPTSPAPRPPPTPRSWCACTCATRWSAAWRTRSTTSSST